MNNRPADWHVLDLDKDPTPGDPDRVRNLAKNLHDFADDVSKVLRDIKGMAGEEAILTWAGKTAESFTAEFEDAPGKLKKLKKSYEMAGDALSTYWPELERAQALADKALAKGREAQGSLSSAQTRLTSADSWVDKAGKEADKYKDDKDSGKSKDVPPPDPDKVKAATRNATSAEKAQSDAKSDVTAAQSNLDAAKKMAEDARKMREDAAGTAKKKLEDASDAGIQNRKWWEEVGDWVTDNWDTIVAVCKVVVAVLGVIAMIIGGPILAAIVVVAALVVLADTLNKYAKGEAGLLDVAFAALDCIPGGKGLTTVGKLAKGMKGLAKGGLKGLGKGLKNGLRRGADDAATSKPAKSRCKNGDPVDMISGEMIMEETDVELPGLLPLVLRRTHLSTYASGRWFGPSWASTLDERLELDSEGVLFATDDGMILSYPVPAPGTSVMPQHGPRLPLDWDGAPDAPIRITDPVTGHTRHFAPLSRATRADEAFTLPLAAISDRNGRRVEFDRNEDGTPTAVRDSAGRHLHVDTEDGRVTGLRLRNPDDSPDGTTLIRYGYTAGHLTDIFNSSGLPLKLTYDEHARVTSWTDRNDSWYRFTYDDQDRCIRGEGADGHLSCTIAYDTDDRSTHYTDSLGHTTAYRHNEQLQLVAQTDPLGHTTSAEWDAYDRMLSRTDPLGHTSRFSYDERGNLTRITRPDGSVTTAEYDASDRPLMTTLPTGGTRRYAYDEQGRPTGTVDPLGALTTFTYDDFGGLTSVTNALGATHRAEPHATGLPLATTPPLSDGTRLTRDAFGRIVTSANGTGAVTRTVWTVESRPAERLLPDGTGERWWYDAEGNVVRYTGPGGRTVTYGFTHFDRRSWRTEGEGADASTVHFTYDTELRLTAVTGAAGAAWTYTYDAAGRLTGETDFNGRSLTYAYDAAGRLTERTNGADETTVYVRDACGRVIERRSHDSVSSFAYDAAGRLVRATTRETELAFTRDASGRVLSERCNGRTLHSTYDVLGRRVARRTPAGAVSQWEWDANNRPTQVRVADRGLAFSYGASGHETERRIGDTAVLTQAWDAGHRLTGQTLTTENGDSLGGPLLQRSYAYGQDGGLTSVEDRTHGTRRFTHDRHGRVESVTADDWSERYAYDAAGNVSGAETPEGPQGERVYDGTLVRRSGHITYVHDAQGRLIRQSRKLLSGGARTWTYTWDTEDRLVAVITPDGRHWTYVYDALGRRVAKRLLSPDGEGRPVEETVFTWDGTHLAEQRTSADGAITSWEWAPGTNRALLQLEHDGTDFAADGGTEPGGPVDQAEVDRRFYAIVTDLVGTPTELVDEEGRVAWRARTTLWGTQVAGGAAAGADCPLRFPGQYLDLETGLHYNFQRYYDPANARYLSPDPLGLAPAPNHHAYVLNPLRWTDPWGLAPSCEGSHGITSARETHIEGQHGPGAQDRARETADYGTEPNIPGEFSDDFLWDGDNFALGNRLREGIQGTPAMPNPRATMGQDSHIHRFDYGSPVGVNGSGRVTNEVEVVIRDGNIHTAYPI